MAVHPAKGRGRRRRRALLKGLALAALLTQVCLAAHVFEHAISVGHHHGAVDCVQCVGPAGGAPLPIATMPAPPTREAVFVPHAPEYAVAVAPAVSPSFEPRAPPSGPHSVA